MERPDRLADSVDAASRFLGESIRPDGFWSDFLTLAGESVYWVTGYVGYALARSAALGGEERRRLLLSVGLPHPRAAVRGRRLGVRPRSPRRRGLDVVVPPVPLEARDAGRGEPREGDCASCSGTRTPSTEASGRTRCRSEVGRYMMLDASVSFRRLVLLADVRDAGGRPCLGRVWFLFWRRQGPGVRQEGADAGGVLGALLVEREALRDGQLHGVPEDQRG